MKPKIFLLIGDHPFNKALSYKLNEYFNITGIVYERRNGRDISKLQFKEIVDKLLSKLLLRKLNNAWFDLLEHYHSRYPNYLNVPELLVENINSNSTLDFFSNNPAPLILVSGTRLIKQNILDLRPDIGIVNLHTGLSPYINGGPNCTNWCLSNNTFHLIGNTVMWLDLGIDSGNIISTKTVDFTGEENLTEVYVKVFEESHELYINAARSIFDTPKLVPNIQQSRIANGITYYNRMWTFSKKIRTLNNFRKFKTTIESQEYIDRKKSLKTIHCTIK